MITIKSQNIRATQLKNIDPLVASYITHLYTLVCDSLDVTFCIKMSYIIFLINHVNNRSPGTADPNKMVG